MMRVLVACEFSGVVRDAFAARGHDAWSCDLRETERPGNHIKADVLTILNDGWDMMVAHPPCTYTSRAGARWFKSQPDRIYKARQGYEFFMSLASANIEKIALENTYGLLWQWYRKPDQVVNPFDFGEPYSKATCLWLKNLPPLMSTLKMVHYDKDWVANQGRTEKQRSRSWFGMAKAMAEQWS